MLIEICHIPSSHEPTFQLIREFFQILFNPEKNIFICGNIDELYSFVPFKLFTCDQIHLSHNINLQDEFKIYWNEQHPHQSGTLSSTECLCEECLGLQPNNPWSLQNATAFAINQWLDKRQTKSSFDIGLDPQLYHFNSNEIEHRASLSRYAAYDCLSMQQLIFKLNNIEQQEIIIHSSNELCTNTSDDSIATPLDNDQHDLLRPQINETESNEDVPRNPTNELEMISDDEITGENPSLQQDTLTREERKKIHNRSCTIKQRKKYYRHEIIRRGIDRRFRIKKIKQILRELNINFSAVNTSTSKITKRTSLYIGIKEKHSLRLNEQQTKHLCTTDYLKQLQQNRSSTIDDRRTTYDENRYHTYKQKH